MSYKPKISSWLQKELERLETGSAAEKQRYRNVITALAKVEANPLNPDFNKDLPDNYKAVDVLQQYRLFFKIIHEGEEAIIYFAWMNDEESLHRAGAKDDCYAIFRTKFAQGEIERYVPEPEAPEPTFEIQGKWGDSYLYVFFSCPPDHAASSLFLNQVTEKEYRIEGITVTEEGKRLASELMCRLCADAGIRKVTLTFELVTWQKNVDKSRHLLEKHGFRCTATIDDVEIWVRSAGG